MSANTTPLNPATMTYSALLCAAAACEQSVHKSDRIFAAECVTELHRRLDEQPSIPEPLRIKRRAMAMREVEPPRKPERFTKCDGRWMPA